MSAKEEKYETLKLGNQLCFPALCLVQRGDHQKV